jgi:hypothetical protein
MKLAGNRARRNWNKANRRNKDKTNKSLNPNPDRRSENHHHPFCRREQKEDEGRTRTKQKPPRKRETKHKQTTTKLLRRTRLRWYGAAHRTTSIGHLHLRKKKVWIKGVRAVEVLVERRQRTKSLEREKIYKFRDSIKVNFDDVALLLMMWQCLGGQILYPCHS